MSMVMIGMAPPSGFHNQPALATVRPKGTASRRVAQLSRAAAPDWPDAARQARCCRYPTLLARTTL
jgi:hypothetical protein